MEKKGRKKKEKLNLKMKCGACGLIGHMRTNKDCPSYKKEDSEKPAPINVAMTQEQEEEEEKQLGDDELVKTEGTKILLDRRVIAHADKIRRQSLVLRFPKENIKQTKKRRVNPEPHCDYLKRPKQSKNRRRADPQVIMSGILEEILNAIRELPYTQPFHTAVEKRKFPDYYKIVSKPIALQTIRDNVRKHRYASRDSFEADINQIVDNSILYNGEMSPLTMVAKNMLLMAQKKMQEKTERMSRLEMAINPLLGDDDQLAFSFILDNILTALKLVPESWPFHNPVNPKKVRDYYKIIKYPMDLESIRKNIVKHYYHSSEEFLKHVERIRDNCIQYNGKESQLTSVSEKVLETCKSKLLENEEHISQLERDIALAQEAVLKGAEAEGFGRAPRTPMSGGNDDSLLGYEEDSLASGDRDGMGEMEGDYIDIEGEDSRTMEGFHDESSVLLNDLQLTPDNSEDDDDDFESEDDESKQGPSHKLSDEEHDEDDEDNEMGASASMSASMMIEGMFGDETRAAMFQDDDDSRSSVWMEDESMDVGERLSLSQSFGLGKHHQEEEEEEEDDEDVREQSIDDGKGDGDSEDDNDDDGDDEDDDMLDLDEET